MSRNRSKIGLCGPKSVRDHGDGISYFVTQDSTDLFLVDTWVSISCIVLFTTVFHHFPHRWFIYDPSSLMTSHNSTGVSSGVSLVKKIELGFESNLGKTDYRVQK